MRGGSGNRVIPLQSTRFCSYVQFFFAAPFVSLSFFLGLCFFSFSVRFRDEQEGGKAERERETNEQQPLRGSCYPRSIGVYSPGVPLQTRFTYPRYIYIYYIFAGVSPLFFTVRWKKRYERFAPCIFPPTEEERIFIYVCRYVRAPWAICSKTRRGRRIIKI